MFCHPSWKKLHKGGLQSDWIKGKPQNDYNYHSTNINTLVKKTSKS